MRIQNLVEIAGVLMVCAPTNAQVTSAGIGSAAYVPASAKATSSAPTPAAATPTVPAQASPCTPPANGAAGKEGIITDTKGVDFKPYMAQVSRITQASWNPLIPRNAQAPFNESGVATLCFLLLPNGHLKDGSLLMIARTGDPAMDRAAEYAIVNSVYPPLPAEFKGPGIEIRFSFVYNPDRKPAQTRDAHRPPELVDMVEDKMEGLFKYKAKQ